MSAPEWRGRASCTWGGGASWWPAVRPGAPGVERVEWGGLGGGLRGLGVTFGDFYVTCRLVCPGLWGSDQRIRVPGCDVIGRVWS